MEGMIYLSFLLARGVALVLGSVGVFWLYASCMGAPVAAHAIVCLGSATIIILACGEKMDAR
jgi:hypothetical protein